MNPSLLSFSASFPLFGLSFLVFLPTFFPGDGTRPSLMPVRVHQYKVAASPFTPLSSPSFQFDPGNPRIPVPQRLVCFTFPQTEGIKAVTLGDMLAICRRHTVLSSGRPNGNNFSDFENFLKGDRIGS